MRKLFVSILSLALTGPIMAQAIPGGGQTRPPDVQQPRRGSSGSGIGGIGLSINLGKKKKKSDKVVGPPQEMQDQEIADTIPDQVIFVIEGQSDIAPRIATATRVTIIDTAYLDESNCTMVVAQLMPGDTVAMAMARLQKQKGVSNVQPNYQYQLLGSSRPKRFDLHALPKKIQPVSGHVVIIDAVVDTGHSNLKGAKVSQQFFGTAKDPAVHGTAVAALLVGTGDYPGTANGARLTSLAAFGGSAKDDRLSRTSYLAKAMNEASRLRPDVLNLSFGAQNTDPLLARTLDTIRKNGICVAAASGNGGAKGKVLFPATHAASLAVTAVDDKLRGYVHATRGERVDVSGVGVGLNAAAPGGRRAVSGTSFATAVISGALMRMPACNGGRDPGSMKAQVSARAQDLGVAGRDPVFGAGLFRLSAGKK
jgi:Subtilase family